MDKKWKKCDFCEKSLPNGKCYWSSQCSREDDCRKAIKRMMSVIKDSEKRQT